MSKKNKREKSKHSVPKKTKSFLIDPRLDNYIRNLMNLVAWPLEQRINILLSEIDTVRSNVMIANTMLERKGIIDRAEFFAEFQEYELKERGIVDATGNMTGTPIFSLYNFGE